MRGSLASQSSLFSSMNRYLSSILLALCHCIFHRNYISVAQQAIFFRYEHSSRQLAGLSVNQHGSEKGCLPSMRGVVAGHMSHAVTAYGGALNQLLTVPVTYAGPYSDEARAPRAAVNKISDLVHTVGTSDGVHCFRGRVN